MSDTRATTGSIQIHGPHWSARLDLYDGDLSPIAVAYGHLERELAPGLYRVDVHLAGRLVQRIVAIRAGAAEVLTAESWGLAAPTALPDDPAAWTTLQECCAAPATAGAGRLIFCAVGPAARVRLVRELRLLDPEGRKFTRLGEGITEGNAWAAVALDLPPGLYTLRSGRRGVPVRHQPVWVESGWATLVCMPAEGTLRPGQAALAMSPIGAGFHQEEAGLAETLLWATWRSEPLRAVPALAPTFAGEWRDPWLGIVAAYHVLAHGDVPAAHIDRLRHTIPGHPDVQALALDAAEPEPMVTLPTLWEGVRRWSEYDLRFPGAIPAEEPFFLARAWSLVDSPYIAWRNPSGRPGPAAPNRAIEASPAAPVADALPELLRNLAHALDHDAPAPSPLRLAASLDDSRLLRQLAVQLALPTSLVERHLAALRAAPISTWGGAGAEQSTMTLAILRWVAGEELGLVRRLSRAELVSSIRTALSRLRAFVLTFPVPVAQAAGTDPALLRLLEQLGLSTEDSLLDRLDQIEAWLDAWDDVVLVYGPTGELVDGNRRGMGLGIADQRELEAGLARWLASDLPPSRVEFQLDEGTQVYSLRIRAVEGAPGESLGALVSLRDLALPTVDAETFLHLGRLIDRMTFRVLLAEGGAFPDLADLLVSVRTLMLLESPSHEFRRFLWWSVLWPYAKDLLWASEESIHTYAFVTQVDRIGTGSPTNLPVDAADMPGEKAERKEVHAHLYRQMGDGLNSGFLRSFLNQLSESEGQRHDALKVVSIDYTNRLYGRDQELVAPLLNHLSRPEQVSRQVSASDIEYEEPFSAGDDLNLLRPHLVRQMVENLAQIEQDRKGSQKASVKGASAADETDLPLDAAPPRESAEGESEGHPPSLGGAEGAPPKGEAAAAPLRYNLQLSLPHPLSLDTPSTITLALRPEGLELEDARDQGGKATGDERPQSVVQIILTTINGLQMSGSAEASVTLGGDPAGTVAHFMVRADYAGAFRLRFHFVQDGHYRGSITAAAEAFEGTSVLRTHSVIDQLYLHDVSQAVTSASAILLVERESAESRHVAYTFIAPGQRSTGSHYARLPLRLEGRLQEALNQIRPETSSVVEEQQALASLGRYISKLLPSATRVELRAYLRRHGHGAPLQIVSDDLLIPWDLMVDAELAGEPLAFGCVAAITHLQQHRWYGDEGKDAAQVVIAGAALAFADRRNMGEVGRHAEVAQEQSARHSSNSEPAWLLRSPAHAERLTRVETVVVLPQAKHARGSAGPSPLSARREQLTSSVGPIVRVYNDLLRGLHAALGKAVRGVASTRQGTLATGLGALSAGLVQIVGYAPAESDHDSNLLFIFSDAALTIEDLSASLRGEDMGDDWLLMLLACRDEWHLSPPDDEPVGQGQRPRGDAALYRQLMLAAERLPISRRRMLFGSIWPVPLSLSARVELALLAEMRTSECSVAEALRRVREQIWRQSERWPGMAATALSYRLFGFPSTRYVFRKGSP